jgi:hypothetical protein
MSKMANSQTVHIPVKSKRVLTFINAKYAPDGFYKLSQKQTLGVFITSILVSKKKSDHVCFNQLQNSFTVKLGSYKHLDQKCFIKASAVPEFNRYVEHLMKEYFYAWMAFYASFPKTDIKSTIENFLAIHNMPDSETDVEYFRTAYKRYKNKNSTQTDQ